MLTSFGMCQNLELSSTTASNEWSAAQAVRSRLSVQQHRSPAYRFAWGLGMALVAKSDQSTGNSAFASYALQSGELVFTLTAPYSRACRQAAADASVPMPWYDQERAYSFLNSHGLAVRAVGTFTPALLLKCCPGSRCALFSVLPSIIPHCCALALPAVPTSISTEPQLSEQPTCKRD